MHTMDQSLAAVVKLAVMTCACDGELHPDEDSLLQEWIDEKPSQYSICLNRAFNDAMKLLKAKGIELRQVCEELASHAPVSLKYDAMELCLRIAQVDGLGADDEMRFLMSIGKWLDLDYDKFREMQHKILPADIHENIDVDFLLGLHSGMLKEEKLKHLTREHGRWNQATTHTDPRKRANAKQMLDIIGKKWSEVQDG